METVSNKLYEGMFLVDSALAASDWDGVLEMIKNLLGRSGAEVVSLKKWDERKLAYEIDGKSRGTYLLCYFKVDGSKISEIETSVKLSEQIMRVLILSTEPMSEEDIAKETPMMAAERKQAEAEESKAAEAEDAAEEADGSSDSEESDESAKEDDSEAKTDED